MKQMLKSLSPGVLKPVFIAVCLAVTTQSVALELKSDNQKYSYAVGNQLGQRLQLALEQMKQDGAEDLDTSAFIAAVRDVLEGKDSQLSVADMRAAFEMQARKAQAKKLLAGKQALEKGQAFLEKNKSAEGVKVLENGMQYIVLKAGTGEQPKASDQVEVHYHGTLISGDVFDSSVQRGQPITFPLGNVIPGFREAITRMKTGGKWRVFIPSNLAYGEAGSPPKIGPNETLIFEIELLSIK